MLQLPLLACVLAQPAQGDPCFDLPMQGQAVSMPVTLSYSPVAWPSGTDVALIAWAIPFFSGFELPGLGGPTGGCVWLDPAAVIKIDAFVFPTIPSSQLSIPFNPNYAGVSVAFQDFYLGGGGLTGNTFDYWTISPP